MKIDRKHKKQKVIIISTLLTLVLVGIVGGLLYFFTDIFRKPEERTPSPLESRTLEGINNAPATEEQANGGNSAKKDLANQDSGQTIPVNSLTIDLIAFKKSNGDVKVTANIQNFTTSTGSCKLSVTKGDVTKTFQAEVTSITGYSTCKGFDISGLESGVWQVRVDITSDGHTGNSTTIVEV